jgi:hypothetical protein
MSGCSVKACGRSSRLWAASIVAVACGAKLEAQQAASDSRTSAPTTTWAIQGDQVDVYLRALQDVGRLDARPWSLRQIASCLAPPTDSAPMPGAWRVRLSCGATSRRLHVAPLQAGATYNSSRPFGLHGGPTWAGVGVTGAVRAGVSATYGPLSMTLAPVAFWAQNAPFGGAVVARSPFIDMPDRFGSGSYARIDPGESEVRVTAFGLTAGLSSAVEIWGPARTHALVLGPHAGGIPRFFAGTAKPIDVGIGRVHGRMILGRLGQSSYTDIPADSATRLAAGLVAVFQPRVFDGMEIGGGRFFHRVSDHGVGAGDLLVPFEGLLKARLRDKDDPTKSPADNQIASLFFRWATRGIEVYGEYARDDHNADLRDLTVEPDHESAYLVGFQRTWAASDAVTVLTAEVVNARITHLSRVRGEGAFYVHTMVRQGHTNRGLVLGTPAAPGGGGMLIALDRYGTRGRVGVRLDRIPRGVLLTESTADEIEMLHVLSVELSRLDGARELFVTGGPLIASRSTGSSLGAHLAVGVRVPLMAGMDR